MAQNAKKPRRGKTVIAQKLQDLISKVEALRTSGAIAEALTLLDDYDRAHPDEALVLAQQIVCHSALGDTVAMLAALERLDALRPDDPATLLHLMNLRQQQGLPVQLLYTAERFLTLAPDHPERAQVQRLRDGTLRALRPSLRALGLVAGPPPQDQAEPASLEDIDLDGLRAIEDHEAGTQRLQRGDFRGAAVLFEKTLARLPHFFAARDALALDRKSVV